MHRRFLLLRGVAHFCDHAIAGGETASNLPKPYCSTVTAELNALPFDPTAESRSPLTRAKMPQSKATPAQSNGCDP
jgi:hypothetical protein